MDFAFQDPFKNVRGNSNVWSEKCFNSRIRNSNPGFSLSLSLILMGVRWAVPSRISLCAKLAEKLIFRRRQTEEDLSNPKPPTCPHRKDKKWNNLISTSTISCLNCRFCFLVDSYGTCTAVSACQHGIIVQWTCFSMAPFVANPSAGFSCSYHPFLRN